MREPWACQPELRIHGRVEVDGTDEVTSQRYLALAALKAPQNLPPHDLSQIHRARPWPWLGGAHPSGYALGHAGTELTFVINALGEIVGYTVGNDMPSRPIEAENSFRYL